MLLKVTVDGVVYEVEVEVEEDTRPPLGAIFMGGGFVPQHAATPAAAPPPDDGDGGHRPAGRLGGQGAGQGGSGDRGRRRADPARGDEDGDRDHRPAAQAPSRPCSCPSATRWSAARCWSRSGRRGNRSRSVRPRRASGDVRPLSPGIPLRSWPLPFGYQVRVGVVPALAEVDPAGRGAVRPSRRPQPRRMSMTNLISQSAALCRAG